MPVTPDTVPSGPAPSRRAPRAVEERAASTGVEVVLQVSRFPWGEDPLGWLRDVALAADEAGFAGLALMDHLIQIPQVGRAWDPIPEPVGRARPDRGAGHRAAARHALHAGHVPASRDHREGVRHAGGAHRRTSLLGIGAGWWEREHAAFALPFPPAPERLDELEHSIRVMRALWAPGTKPTRPTESSLPETTCYPRPVGRSRSSWAGWVSGAPCASRRSSATRAT